MAGKDICEFLKGIRKRIAEANGIAYEPRECTFEGDCTGTCPFCEKEAADLFAALKEKEKQGIEIQRDEFSSIFLEKGKMDFDEADELRRREQEETGRIIREQERPLMGDIDFESYRKVREEELRLENERRKKESSF